jgi:hypothetical protein
MQDLMKVAVPWLVQRAHTETDRESITNDVPFKLNLNLKSGAENIDKQTTIGLLNMASD